MRMQATGAMRHPAGHHGVAAGDEAPERGRGGGVAAAGRCEEGRRGAGARVGDATAVERGDWRCVARSGPGEILRRATSRVLLALATTCEPWARMAAEHRPPRECFPRGTWRFGSFMPHLLFYPLPLFQMLRDILHRTLPILWATAIARGHSNNEPPIITVIKFIQMDEILFEWMKNC
jgi:hypothetical protein